LKWRIAWGALAIGVFGLVLSCIYMENPYAADVLFYGYPFLWLETSKSLMVQFPPIPNRIIILPGLYFDFLLYSAIGLVFSYLVFTLNESLKLMKFFLKSGAILVVGLFMFGFMLTGSGPTPGVGPIGMGVMLVILFALPLDVVCTIAYGYYRLFTKWGSRRARVNIIP
jgi:hypothetical protein